MPRRPDALETIRLAIELLRRIPRKRKVTALELLAYCRHDTLALVRLWQYFSSFPLPLVGRG